jgi:hypothetical protein
MWYRRNVDDLAAFNFAELKLVKETWYISVYTED